jgi:hypothetical protein
MINANIHVPSVINEHDNEQLDAAVARPLSPEAIAPGIIGIGLIRGIAEAGVGQGVQKSGRSSGYTRGRVTVVGTTITVGFGAGRTARFTNQIVTSKMAESGDSGSLLLDLANRAVGLLFAGGAKATLYHPIRPVLHSLNIRLTDDDTVREHRFAEQRALHELCQARADQLMQLPNVVGVGVGSKITAGQDTGRYCLTVLVSSKLPAGYLRENDAIPAEIDQTPTDVVECGQLSTEFSPWYNPRQNRMASVRPARPGLSIGHFRVSAGTFGAVVYDRDTDEPLILSNNHVLANATDGTDGLAAIGDPILQPGRRDGGEDPRDLLGTLLRFSPLAYR